MALNLLQESCKIVQLFYFSFVADVWMPAIKLFYFTFIAVVWSDLLNLTKVMRMANNALLKIGKWVK